MGNVTGTVAAKFAFFPPEPPTYDVSREEDGRVVVSGVTADKNVDVHIIHTKGGNEIVATFWKHPFIPHNTFLLTPLCSLFLPL